MAFDLGLSAAGGLIGGLAAFLGSGKPSTSTYNIYNDLNAYRRGYQGADPAPLHPVRLLLQRRMERRGPGTETELLPVLPHSLPGNIARHRTHHDHGRLQHL